MHAAAGTGAGSDLAQSTVDDVFWGLILADEDLLRAQFDEVVTADDPAGARPELPLSRPRPGPDAPAPPRHRQVAHRPVDGRRQAPAARQRSPPTGP